MDGPSSIYIFYFSVYRLVKKVTLIICNEIVPIPIVFDLISSIFSAVPLHDLKRMNFSLIFHLFIIFWKHLTFESNIIRWKCRELMLCSSTIFAFLTRSREKVFSVNKIIEIWHNEFCPPSHKSHVWLMLQCICRIELNTSWSHHVTHKS